MHNRVEAGGTYVTSDNVMARLIHDKTNSYFHRFLKGALLNRKYARRLSFMLKRVSQA